jgi:predicted transcriptional regulator
MAETEKPDANALALTAQIVSAHVANNSVSPEELPDLIRNVFAALGSASNPVPALKPEPAVPIRQSLRPDAIVCLEDGKSFSMLKRHLMSDHKMTPQQYRAKWDLPRDYPMVAPNYATVRSNLAKQIGLGRIGKGPVRKASAKLPPVKKAARIKTGRPRGRPKKII